MRTHILSRVLGISVMICASGAAFASTASAATIVNNFTATADSGGNSAAGGEIVEGKSRNSVSVYTEINGEVVEDYDATSSDPVTYTTAHSAAAATVAQNANAGARVETEASGSILQSLREGIEKTEAEIEAELEEAAETLQNVEVTANAEGEVEEKDTGTGVSWFVSLQAAVKNFFAYVLAWF